MKRSKYLKCLILVLCLVSITGCKKSNEKIQEFYISVFENNKSYLNADKKEEFIEHYTKQGYSVSEYAFVDYGEDGVTDVVARLASSKDSDLDDIGLILTYDGGKVYGHEIDQASIEVVSTNGYSYFHGEDSCGWKTYIIDKTSIKDDIVYSKSYDDEPVCVIDRKEASCDDYLDKREEFTDSLSFDVEWNSYSA